ncbi:hypothetical protein NE237_003324 [Protea cynaroides]|uniref:Uncharacterized protein n=1 Tax=Protea cynaroides TaxID=273540 RepID=A0A9Q0QSB7_9MAGN|nr:hypothetical protein NE237_003324 [Protea cynaroides]
MPNSRFIEKAKTLFSNEDGLPEKPYLRNAANLVGGRRGEDEWASFTSPINYQQQAEPISKKNNDGVLTHGSELMEECKRDEDLSSSTSKYAQPTLNASTVISFPNKHAPTTLVNTQFTLQQQAAISEFVMKNPDIVTAILNLTPMMLEVSIGAKDMNKYHHLMPSHNLEHIPLDINLIRLDNPLTSKEQNGVDTNLTGSGIKVDHAGTELQANADQVVHQRQANSLSSPVQQAAKKVRPSSFI